MDGRITTILALLGMTKQDIAKDAGVSAATLTQIDNGRMPKLVTQYKIADAVAGRIRQNPRCLFDTSTPQS